MSLTNSDGQPIRK